MVREEGGRGEEGLRSPRVIVKNLRYQHRNIHLLRNENSKYNDEYSKIYSKLKLHLINYFPIFVVRNYFCYSFYQIDMVIALNKWTYSCI